MNPNEPAPETPAAPPVAATAADAPLPPPFGESPQIVEVPGRGSVQITSAAPTPEPAAKVLPDAPDPLAVPSPYAKEKAIIEAKLDALREDVKRWWRVFDTHAGAIAGDVKSQLLALDEFLIAHKKRNFSP